jgi:hypothetical protein
VRPNGLVQLVLQRRGQRASDDATALPLGGAADGDGLDLRAAVGGGVGDQLRCGDDGGRGGRGRCGHGHDGQGSDADGDGRPGQEGGQAAPGVGGALHLGGDLLPRSSRRRWCGGPMEEYAPGLQISRAVAAMRPVITNA